MPRAPPVRLPLCRVAISMSPQTTARTGVWLNVRHMVYARAMLFYHSVAYALCYMLKRHAYRATACRIAYRGDIQRKRCCRPPRLPRRAMRRCRRGENHGGKQYAVQCRRRFSPARHVFAVRSPPQPHGCNIALPLATVGCNITQPLYWVVLMVIGLSGILILIVLVVIVILIRH